MCQTCLQQQLLLFCPSAVLKLLKMATGMRALLDTVMQALPQVKTKGGVQKLHTPVLSTCA